MGAGSSVQASDRVNLEQAQEHLPSLFKALAASDARGSVDGTISAMTFVSLFRKAQCANLFSLWDADGSKFLEISEFNSVLALYNGVDFDSLTGDQKKEEAAGFLKYYDDNGKADGKVDAKELLEWLEEEVGSFTKGGGSNFDDVVKKLTEIVSISNLFRLLDIDSSGKLEVCEFNAVLALYNGQDYDQMTAEQKKEEAAGFLKWYDDHGESDKKLDRKEFSDWLWEEVNSFGSAKQDENFLSVTKKLRELAMVSRLFTTMDKDSSGFLEPKEFNSILATYNGQDWSSMSHEEKKADTEGFLKFYDDHGEADKKLDRKEFSEWLWEEVISFGSAREDENFAAVVEKLESLTSSSSS